MDEGSQIKEVVSLWDAALWLIAALWACLMWLAKRTWNQQEKRMYALEQSCKVEHKQRISDLNQHAVADANQHEAIKLHLAEEIKTLNTNINDTRREIKRDMELVVGLLRGEKQ